MKKYIFKPYSKNFPELFQKERDRIVFNVNVPLVIEHIGSTAVPGLGGKGIIDIGIAIDKKDMELVSEKLQAIGYEFRPNFSTEDRFYFIACVFRKHPRSHSDNIRAPIPQTSARRIFFDKSLI